jgi:dolichol kinase
MSLADGFAAIVGTRYGRENRYFVFSHAKSVAGTLTFAVVSLAILTGYGIFAVAGLPIAHILIGAAVGTIAENLASFGLDNLVVPLFIGLLLAQW